ncbi:hypothetical protein MHI22_10710 [Lysinibacillus sp. FSL L8-0312]|jgi:hypothetical protein|uniref:hypothetical protein n=1 Tax=Lysinibacillus sp. FSL L8-0312 TaxID=2921521 RepID=UPI0030F5A000
MALNEGDFYWIADMLALGSSAYQKLEKYSNEITYYFYLKQWGIRCTIFKWSILCGYERNV